MRKLLLVTLASSVALIPAAAFAQGNHRGGGHGASHRGSSMSVRHGGSNVNVRHHGRSNVTVRHGGRTIHRGNFNHRRFSRGFVMNRFWLAPRFHVRNWQLYGFAPPPADYRWVRYYDDAYLVDGAGRVHDSRHDLDWDEYGERWDMSGAYDEDGWNGDSDRMDHGDHGDHAERGAHAEHGMHHEGHGRVMRHGDGQGRTHVEVHRVPAPSCHNPCGGHAYGAYGHGYYGYGQPIIIETTVTTGGANYVTETVEEVVRVRQTRQPRRHRRPAPPRRPRPPAGERG